MSAPVRESDDRPLTGGPLNYAPKRFRHAKPERDSNPAEAPPKGDAAPRSAVRESTELRRRPSKQRGAFVGDVAITELRNKLALAPDRLLAPPPSLSTGPKYTSAGRLAGVVVAAMAGVIGYQWGSAPPSPRPQPEVPSGQSNQQGLASKRSVAYPPQSVQPIFASPAAAKAVVLQPNEQKSRDAASSSRAMSPQLMVSAVRPQQADEAARLTVTAKDAGANAAVVIGGLARGSALSVGTQVGPNTWRLSVEEVTRAVITPPRSFVGAMALTLELRRADNTVADRKDLQLEWPSRSVLAPANSQPRRHDAAEVASIMKKGAELMANGDVSGARLLYRRLAEEGEALAAFALAEAYDPLVLRKSSNTRGIAPDVAMAQSWYEKAKNLGSIAAPDRLGRLARLPE
jgi:TPR repeat protein